MVLSDHLEPQVAKLLNPKFESFKGKSVRAGKCRDRICSSRGFAVDSLLKVNFELDVDEEDRILTTPNSHRSLNPASPDKARRRYRISAHGVGASVAISWKSAIESLFLDATGLLSSKYYLLHL